MIIQTINTSGCCPQTIVIGRRGTYDTMQIAFDLSYLVESFGNGVAVLAVKRSQDSSAYPAVVAQEDSTVTWTVSETDTYYKGAGECELMWYVDGGLAKTIIYPMVVMRDILSTTEEAPDAYQTWVDDLTALGAETLQNAQDAAQSASDAETAKDDAVAAKEAAEEAQEAAETAVTHYPKIENNYWMVWDSTSQSYVSTGIQAEGEDGYSPEVTITSIEGGHRVTITDKDHPQGQSFDVMDGQGGGGTSDYTDLTNKPSINNVTLTENKTAADLGLATPSDIPTDAGDIEFDDQETYAAGSVGAELSAQSNAIDQLEDGVQDLSPVVPNTDSGDIVFISDGAGDRQIQKIVGTIKTDAGNSGWTQAKVWQQTGNLFDKNALKRGYALNDRGVEIANSNFGVTGLIRVGLNAGDHIKVKYITGSGTQWTFRCIGYKENGDYDREVFNVTITSGTEARDITLSSGVYYVRLSVGIVNRQNLDVLQFKCDKNVLTIPFGTTVSNGTITLNEDKSADVVDSDNDNTYHLPNVGSVNTLYGTNNMWIDCGSITDIQYQADTKLYVDAQKSRLIDNYLNKGRMQFCAHRGARTEAPENSIPAFEIAGQNGFDWLNLAQLRQSADGTWYVMHDATVDRTTDGTGNIKDLTDAYLSTLHIDTGAHVSDFTPAELVIPTLEDAIKIARKYGMKLYFRIGAVPSDWTSFLTIIRKYRCDGMLFGSNSLAEIMPLAELGYCVNWDVYNATDAEYQIVSYINSGIKNATLFVSASVITDTLVQLARSNGYKVMAFDPSDTSVTLTKAQAQQLSDMGVDVVSAPVKFNLAE